VATPCLSLTIELQDIYYISFPGDRVVFKIAVVYVYLVGVAQTALALFDLHLSLTTGLQPAENQRAKNQTSFPWDHLWFTITLSTGAGAGLFLRYPVVADSS
jgi:hypothetical protein